MSVVLVVARELPYPPTAGDRIVTHGFARTLRERGHDVHVLAYERSGDGPDAPKASLYESADTVEKPDSHLPPPLRQAVRNLRGRSDVMTRYDSTAMRRATARRVRALAPDVVLAQHPYMGQVFRDPAVAAALDDACATSATNAHVVECEAHRRRRSYASGLRTKVALAAEIPLLRRAERAVYDRSDRTLVLGEEDERVLAGAVSGPVVRQRIALDADRYEPAQTGEETPGRLLFFGSYDWFPNEDAILYFCDEVFPKVRRDREDAELVVAGRGATDPVRELGDRPGVRFRGEVDDLGDLVRSASVVVAPVRVGGGVRIKVLESMAWGAPVVTTPSGFEGVDAEPGRDLVVAEGAEQFAAGVTALLDRPRRRYAVARAGRATVRERYAPAAVGPSLEAALGLSGRPRDDGHHDT